MGLMMLMMAQTGMMGMTGAMGMPFLPFWMPFWGLVTGAVMIVGAFRVRSSAAAAMPWGVAVLVASGLSLLAMGGFVIGAALGVVGGALSVAAARHA